MTEHTDGKRITLTVRRIHDRGSAAI